jgi:hypothetical protein
MPSRKSPQAEAKNRQGYIEKPTPRICSTCLHFTSGWLPAYPGSSYMVEKDKRCTIGQFAVKKTAVCNDYEYKPAE